jgi:DNA-binding MarR family transcriptional regulator
MSGVRDRNVVLEVLEAMRDRDQGILLNSVVAFLYVAENEGIGVKELAYLCRLNEATTSRCVRALASADAPGALPPALGLVSLSQNPRDARGRSISLTDEGRILCARIDAAIARAVPISNAVSEDTR